MEKQENSQEREDRIFSENLAKIRESAEAQEQEKRAFIEATYKGAADTENKSLVVPSPDGFTVSRLTAGNLPRLIRDRLDTAISTSGRKAYVSVLDHYTKFLEGQPWVDPKVPKVFANLRQDVVDSFDQETLDVAVDNIRAYVRELRFSGKGRSQILTR